MPYPEDRVLVGVIKARRDLIFARDAGWYRIPYHQMPDGIEAEWVAFFLSGAVFRQQRSTIAYYGQRGGVELAHRRDLIPTEPDHPRADHRYYRVSIRDWQPKLPPIRNTTGHAFSFIHTTWDRFEAAAHLADLYRDDPHFVDRVAAVGRRQPARTYSPLTSLFSPTDDF